MYFLCIYSELSESKCTLEDFVFYGATVAITIIITITYYHNVRYRTFLL